MTTATTPVISSREDYSEVEAPNIPAKHIYSRHLKKQPPDIYGQKHAIETPDLIQDSLVLLENEIWNLSGQDQATLVRASIDCPEIFESKEHRLMFLRCEQFKVDVSTMLALYILKKTTTE